MFGTTLGLTEGRTGKEKEDEILIKVHHAGVWSYLRVEDTSKESVLDKVDGVQENPSLEYLGLGIETGVPRYKVVYDHEKAVMRELESRSIAIASPRNGSSWVGMRATVPIRVVFLEKNGSVNLFCVKWSSGIDFDKELCKSPDQVEDLVLHIATPGTYTIHVEALQPELNEAKLKSTETTIHLRAPHTDFILPKFDEAKVCVEKLMSNAIVISLDERGFSRTLDQFKDIVNTIERGRVFDTRLGDIGSLVDQGALSKATADRLESETGQVHAERLTRGAVGCALAHISAWERIQESSQFTLIVEDDVWVVPQKRCFNDFVAEAAGKGFDILYLGASPSLYEEPNSVKVSSKLRRIVDNNYGTFAYVLSPQGAEKLLSMGVLPLEYQIDSYLVQGVRSGLLDAYLIDPPLAHEIKTLRESFIQVYT